MSMNKISTVQESFESTILVCLYEDKWVQENSGALLHLMFLENVFHEL